MLKFLVNFDIMKNNWFFSEKFNEKNSNMLKVSFDCRGVARRINVSGARGQVAAGVSFFLPH